jgi:hypothetical protein
MDTAQSIPASRTDNPFFNRPSRSYWNLLPVSGYGAHHRCPNILLPHLKYLVFVPLLRRLDSHLSRSTSRTLLPSITRLYLLLHSLRHRRFCFLLIPIYNARVSTKSPPPILHAILPGKPNDKTPKTKALSISLSHLSKKNTEGVNFKVAWEWSGAEA